MPVVVLTEKIDAVTGARVGGKRATAPFRERQTEMAFGARSHLDFGTNDAAEHDAYALAPGGDVRETSREKWWRSLERGQVRNGHSDQPTCWLCDVLNDRDRDGPERWMNGRLICRGAQQNRKDRDNQPAHTWRTGHADSALE